MQKLYTGKDVVLAQPNNEVEEVTVDDIIQEPTPSVIDEVAFFEKDKEDEEPVLSAAEQLKQFTDNLPKTLAELKIANAGVRPFTVAKSKVQYDISNTSIYPTRLTMASGNFTKAYRKQLDDIIFDFESDVNPTKLVGLLVIVEQVESGAKAIRIRAPGYNKLLPKIVSVLNDFYFTNGQILKGILDMFKGQGQQALAKDKADD